MRQRNILTPKSPEAVRHYLRGVTQQSRQRMPRLTLTRRQIYGMPHHRLLMTIGPHLRRLVVNGLFGLLQPLMVLTVVVLKIPIPLMYYLTKESIHHNQVGVNRFLKSLKVNICGQERLQHIPIIHKILFIQ